MPVDLDLRDNALFKWGAETEGAKILTKIVEWRFGPIPEPIRTRLAKANVETIEQWVDRTKAATTLDEIFGEP
jgi:hypothetical protein